VPIAASEEAHPDNDTSANEADALYLPITLERCKGRCSADSSPAARDERIGRAFVRLTPSGGSLCKRIGPFSSCPERFGARDICGYYSKGAPLLQQPFASGGKISFAPHGEN